jgi:transcription initiation factor TFIID subunit 6
VQVANSYRRRCKGTVLTVDDVNLALASNNNEEIYGLSRGNEISLLSSKLGVSSTSSSSSSSRIINLSEFSKPSTFTCPLLPEISLHWLSVCGVQPSIVENPNVVATDDSDDQAHTLTKEVRFFYERVTRAIIACDDSTLPAIYSVLQTDSGLQEILPYFSRFIYQQVKENSGSIKILNTLMRVIR